MILERQPDASQHEPRALLCDLEVAGNLVAAHTVLAVHYEPHGAHPLVERNRRILEHSSQLYGELASALAALPDATATQVRVLLALAGWALCAVRPAQGG